MKPDLTYGAVFPLPPATNYGVSYLRKGKRYTLDSVFHNGQVRWTWKFSSFSVQTSDINTNAWGRAPW